ncbi:unnamed protein product [Scytosiphon promiscuus]
MGAGLSEAGQGAYDPCDQRVSSRAAALPERDQHVPRQDRIRESLSHTRVVTNRNRASTADRVVQNRESLRLAQEQSNVAGQRRSPGMEIAAQRMQEALRRANAAAASPSGPPGETEAPAGRAQDSRTVSAPADVVAGGIPSYTERSQGPSLAAYPADTSTRGIPATYSASSPADTSSGSLPVATERAGGSSPPPSSSPADARVGERPGPMGGRMADTGARGYTAGQTFDDHPGWERSHISSTSSVDTLSLGPEGAGTMPQVPHVPRLVLKASGTVAAFNAQNSASTKPSDNVLYSMSIIEQWELVNPGFKLVGFQAVPSSAALSPVSEHAGLGSGDWDENAGGRIHGGGDGVGAFRAGACSDGARAGGGAGLGAPVERPMLSQSEHFKPTGDEAGDAIFSSDSARAYVGLGNAPPTSGERGASGAPGRTQQPPPRGTSASIEGTGYHGRPGTHFHRRDSHTRASLHDPYVDSHVDARGAAVAFGSAWSTSGEFRRPQQARGSSIGYGGRSLSGVTTSSAPSSGELLHSVSSQGGAAPFLFGAAPSTHGTHPPAAPTGGGDQAALADQISRCRDLAAMPDPKIRDVAVIIQELHKLKQMSQNQPCWKTFLNNLRIKGWSSSSLERKRNDLPVLQEKYGFDKSHAASQSAENREKKKNG